MTRARVMLWGSQIGAVSLSEGERFAMFEYTDEFAASGIEVAPLAMPLARGIRRFPALDLAAFRGLPGLLADSLPDRYGNALINAWLAARGRSPESFDAVERLSYIGRRGIGALEYEPALGPKPSVSQRLHVAELAALAEEILNRRQGLAASLREPERRAAMREILRVGSSAGGARPKALVALNPGTGELRSGQLDLGPGFEHWILKFDGVSDRSRELGTALGFGAIELAYARMAAAAGIAMSECRILAEGGRRHFMTKRFDRSAGGAKIHMQSLAALEHLDYNQPGAHSYEQALLAIRRLELGHDALEQQFRRMAFNVIARNHDDHAKNIAFLMDRDGNWSLSPAFDLTYSYNPTGEWTAAHQMSINGKRDEITIADLEAAGRVATLARGRAEGLIAEVAAAVERWPEFADEAGVDAERTEAIGRAHRLRLAAA